ncbi:MAG: hypothetical protein QOE38_2584 [Thermoleophilaceae bacterium]|nr:hypothetical protein [Thermoleophilaceae bacterium]
MRNSVVTTLAAIAAVWLFAVPAEAKKRAAPSKVSITVLSSRPDLVSGGSALVAIDFSRKADRRHAKVRVGKRNVTAAFRRSGTRRLLGLVRRLHPGRNVLRATLPSGRGARIALTDHPIGGPIFAGPQLQPWTCQSGARDKQCNQPATFKYVYKSSDPSKSGFQPYDPKNPPSDVATTTTDRGVTVPFIVRVETGYMDRDQYQVAALFQPGKAWTALAPQRQFNHKLLITHGVSCGVDYQTGAAPDVTTGAAETALGRGFATMSTALDYSGHNCNLPLQAESLVMAKEYLTKSYGTLRYTIGTGCSGGSLAEQWIANAYPGVYQGILPTCSFADAWGTATQFVDYHLTLAYFTDPSKWGAGVAWTPTQMSDVQGHVTPVNSEVSDNAQFHVADPTDHCNGVSDQQRYDPNTNPGGVRCSIVDAAINVFGPRPPSVWTAPEKKIGHGFAGIPVDNVGVEYGLGALRSGHITPGQFVDINAKIGGLSIDVKPVANRFSADEPALANAYRSGMINETNNLDRTAIIDCRGPDPGAFHDAYRAFALRARLDRAHGGHANQSIWEGPAPIIGDAQCEVNSFLAMDGWLAAIEKDKAKGTVAQKVARDKPAGVTDRCYDGNGAKVSDGLCPDGVVPVYGTPRTVAGDAITTDANKCQLKPLNRSDDYGPLPFTDAQWAELQQVFPNGVCDFSKPGVDQQGAIPWQTYQGAGGKVIYGGKPMGRAPRSVAIKRR